MRRRRLFALIPVTLISSVSPAFGQGDVTFFLGGAYPVYDERLTLRPSVPSLPGVDVTVAGTPEIRANGGPVFGAALAFELGGVIGIEGRLDATEVGFDLTGARYDLRARPPLPDLTGAVTIGDGRLDANRLMLLSLNARLRTPGPVGIFASGGLSILPDVTITGSVPVTIQIAGISTPGLAPRLRLEVAPGESESRVGLNGGAGVRIGGSRVAVMAEVRVFYFRDFELRFGVDDAPDIVSDLLEDIDPIRFEPVIVNAQAGLVFRF